MIARGQLEADMTGKNQIRIEECNSVESLQGCVDLQRRVFDMPEIEISPVRHFIVTMHAGGFTLGAFIEERLIGFCLSVPALLDGEKALYSHMTAVDGEYQGLGIGALLKWRQRERSLSMGIRSVKWTFQPEKARNAFFNLEKLGAEIQEYMPNFYGTDFGRPTNGESRIGIDSDRLFAVWNLESEKVNALSLGETFTEKSEPAATISIPWDWEHLLRTDRAVARIEQERIRTEFIQNIARGYFCRGFVKDRENPRYLFFTG